MKKQVESRLSDLENKSGSGKKPMIPVFQDWDDPNLWHAGSRQEGDGMSWDEVEAKYSDYVIFQVVYTDDWKASHD